MKIPFLTKRAGVSVLAFGVCLVVVFGLLGEPSAAGFASQQTTTPSGSAIVTTPTLAPVKADDRVIAEGSLVPVQYANLSFDTTGIVTEVLVIEGQNVQAGDVLARLAGSEKLSAAVSAAQLDLLTAQQALDTLNTNAALALSQARLDLVVAKKKADDAQKTRSVKNYIPGDTKSIDNARNEYTIAKHDADNAQAYYDTLKNLPSDNINRAYAYQMLQQAIYRRNVTAAQLDYLTNKPPQQEIDEADAKLQVAKDEMALAQKKVDELSNGPDPDELALDQLNVKNAQAKLDNAKKDLTSLELRAPFSGTIVTLSFKKGEFENPGQNGATLADLTKWQVETNNLTEQMVTRMNESEPASIVFDAIPDQKFSGKVSYIRNLGVSQQGDITFLSVITLDQVDQRLRWNMTATVTIGK
jgi:HlyD family secretion protein